MWEDALLTEYSWLKIQNREYYCWFCRAHFGRKRKHERIVAGMALLPHLDVIKAHQQDEDHLKALKGLVFLKNSSWDLFLVL